MKEENIKKHEKRGDASWNTILHLEVEAAAEEGPEPAVGAVAGALDRYQRLFQLVRVLPIHIHAHGGGSARTPC